MVLEKLHTTISEYAERGFAHGDISANNVRFRSKGACVTALGDVELALIDFGMHRSAAAAYDGAGTRPFKLAAIMDERNYSLYTSCAADKFAALQLGLEFACRRGGHRPPTFQREQWKAAYAGWQASGKGWLEWWLSHDCKTPTPCPFEETYCARLRNFFAGRKDDALAIDRALSPRPGHQPKPARPVVLRIFEVLHG